MQGYPIAGLQTAEITEQGGKLVHLDIEFLIGDVLTPFFFRVRNKMNGGLVSIFRQVPVNTVVADIELAADKPFPAGRIAGNGLSAVRSMRVTTALIAIWLKIKTRRPSILFLNPRKKKSNISPIRSFMSA